VGAAARGAVRRRLRPGVGRPEAARARAGLRLFRQAVDDKTIEARFAIANGYYLYREKLKFAVEPAVLAGAPVLPPGKIKHDEFFGNVETYRGLLAVRLPLEGAKAGTTVTVKAESQGCADAGVCYPPQVQRLTVALPARGAGPGEPVNATPAKKSWFN
jgi:thiol:disulfide interchange protein DsbD